MGKRDTADIPQNPFELGKSGTDIGETQPRIQSGYTGCWRVSPSYVKSRYSNVLRRVLSRFALIPLHMEFFTFAEP